LHYKEITDVAIERDLLSHVGKSPEVTMGARLAAVVKKDPKDNPLVRVKPGVFALRDWDQAVIDSGLADRTPALERLAKLGVHHAEESTGTRDSAEAPALGASSADADDVDSETSGYPDLSGIESDADEEIIGDDERARAELAAAATELFVSEDDDDEPILGGDSELDSADRSDGAAGKRRRRRRRRGGRSAQDEDNGLPSYTVSDAPLLAEVDDDLPMAVPTRIEAPRRGAEARNGESPSRNREARGGEERGRDDRSREARGGDARAVEPRGSESRGGESRGAEARGGESRGRDDRSREARGGEERGRPGRGGEERSREVRGGEERGGDDRRDEGSRETRGGERSHEDRGGEGRGLDTARVSDELGLASVLALLEQLLSPRSRTGSIPLRQLAEQGLRRVRGKVDIQALQDAMAEAVRSEVVRARAERRRPRFLIHGRSVSATDWGMDPEVVRLEKELMSAATRHREAFQRSFCERLQGLQPRAMGDFCSLLLSQIGFEEIEPVRRQGAHNQELHFSAVARSATGDLPTAIIIRRDGRDIGRERVIDLRGALHHYNGAQAGLLATTGQVMSGARDEARVPNAAPVNLLDGAGLAKLSTQHGVGVAWSELRVPMVDIELLDSLTAS
jgi:restriction endonuclease Mrr